MIRPDPTMTRRRSEAENKMPAATAEKCAHPVCTCMASLGRYCSAQCAAMEETPDLDCSCGHPICKGDKSYQEMVSGE
jgi:hypothetical protein